MQRILISVLLIASGITLADTPDKPEQVSVVKQLLLQMKGGVPPTQEQKEARAQLQRMGDTILPILKELIEGESSYRNANQMISVAMQIEGGAEYVKPAIMAFLKSEKAGVRSRVLLRLLPLASSEDVSDIIPLLNDPDSMCRIRASLILGRVGVPEHIPAIEKALAKWRKAPLPEGQTVDGSIQYMEEAIVSIRKNAAGQWLGRVARPWVSHREVTVNKLGEVAVGVTIVNKGKKAATFMVPSRVTTQLPDWFSAQLNGNQWRSKLTVEDYRELRKKIKDRPKRTLQPGESLTLWFQFSDMWELPKDFKQAGFCRLGFTSMPKNPKVSPIGMGPAISTDNSLVLGILPNSVDMGREALAYTVSAPGDLNKAKAFVAISGADTQQKLRLLRMAILEKNADAYWALAAACSEVYPVASTLQTLPAEIVQPKAALELLKSTKDLSLRCKLLETLGKVKSSGELRREVRSFLQTQNDTEVLRVGKKTMSTFQNRDAV